MLSIQDFINLYCMVLTYEWTLTNTLLIWPVHEPTTTHPIRAIKILALSSFLRQFPFAILFHFSFVAISKINFIINYTISKWPYFDLHLLNISAKQQQQQQNVQNKSLKKLINKQWWQIKGVILLIFLETCIDRYILSFSFYVSYPFRA